MASSIFKVSLPTKDQWVKTIEYIFVAFVASTVAVWIKQPEPFSSKAVIVALSAGVAGVAGIARGLFTTL